MLLSCFSEEENKAVKKRTGAMSSKKAKKRQYDLSKGMDTRTVPSHLLFFEKSQFNYIS